MKLYMHRLAGCRPAPLAHYLKALGVLRVVGEQADLGVRGWWQDEQFVVMSVIDREGLELFLAERYTPTPFIDPWNGGSGFYRKDNQKAVTTIASSTAVRFADYRASIEAGHSLAGGLDEKPTKLEKAAMLLVANRQWRGRLKQWFDSAVVLGGQGDATWPSLLGTGGNDGRLDFTNNAMQRLVELFEIESADGHSRKDARPLLREALWRQPIPLLNPKAKIGQFHPGDAGGANSTTGADGESLVNPWDFILMLEGSLLLQSRATRRLDPTHRAGAGAPFALYAHAAGFGSAGAEKSARGEQWLPIWNRPSTLGEVQALFGEARLQVGRTAAARPVDAARALARLGTARGVESFTRFGFLERNGQSTLAVPLGRIAVREHSQSRLIDDLAQWLDRLQRAARADNAPQHLGHAERKLADAVFAALAHEPSSRRWQAVLIAAAQVESLQAKGAAIAAGPIPALRPEWVQACDDGSVEWRLAVCLGSAAARHSRDRAPRDPVRQQWLSLDAKGRFETTDNGGKLARRPEVVMFGRDFVSDAIALVERRLIDAAAEGSRRLPLVAAYSCAAAPGDIAAFLEGDCDDERLSALARACMALRWNRWSEAHRLQSKPPESEPDASWWVVRLACLPWALDDAIDIPADPAVVRRCAAGDGPAALRLALNRLRVHGLRPAFSAGLTDARAARRWAAALAFPISKATARRVASILNPSLNRQEGSRP